MSGLRNFPRRAPKTPQELEYFYLAIIEKLKETPVDLSGLEILFWLLHEDGNHDMQRLEDEIAALRVLTEGERPDTELWKAIQDAAVIAAMTPVPATNNDTEVLIWMGV